MRRRRASLLRYYVYVSKSKLDMLAGQLPDTKVSLGVDVDTPVGNLSLGHEGGLPPAFRRLSSVEEALRAAGVVGPPDDQPAEWIEGAGEMRHGTNNEAAFFCGVFEQTIVWLGGSAKHLLGRMHGQDSPVELSYSSLDTIASSVEELDRHDEPLAAWPEQPFFISDDLAGGVELAYGGIRADPRFKPQRFSFLARALYRRRRWAVNVIVATPLWVALDGPALDDAEAASEN